MYKKCRGFRGFCLFVSGDGYESEAKGKSGSKDSEELQSMCASVDLHTLSRSWTAGIAVWRLVLQGPGWIYKEAR